MFNSIIFILLFSLQYILLITFGLYVSYRLYEKKIFGKPYIVIIAGLISCLIGYAAFWLYFLNTNIGLLFSYFFIVSSLVTIGVIYWKKLYRKYLIPDISIPLLLMFFVGLFYSSTVFACIKPDQPLSLNQQCHLKNITIDNVIPKVFAENIYNHHAKNLIGDWQGSDRPPLQSGAVLLFSPLTLNDKNTLQIGYEILGVLLQTLWIPAVWVLAKKLNLKQKQMSIVLAFCIFSGFFFFNSIFVWPKLLAGSFVILAICLLFFERYSKQRWLIASAAAAMGLLAHSGIIFTLIPMAIILLFKHYNPGWKKLVMAGLLFIALCLPWVTYQKYYNPPGDRLLKWYIAGIINTDSRPLNILIIDSYNSTPIDKVIRNKASNLRTPFGKITKDRLYSNGFFGLIRSIEFHYIFFSFTVLNIGFILLFFKKFRNKVLETISLTKLKAIIGIGVSSTFLWAFVLFGPGATYLHQGSYANMILAFVLLSMMIVLAYRKLALILLSIQFIYFLFIWILSVWQKGYLDTPLVILSLVSLSSTILVLLNLNSKKTISKFIKKELIKKQLQQLKAKIKYYSNEIERYVNKHKNLVITLLIVLSALLIISRRPEAITNAQFWAEDGKYWYQQAYNSNLGSLFLTYGGYFVVIYRIVAEISLSLPLYFVPVFFNITALLFQLLPLLLINSDRMKKIIPSRNLAILVSILYVCVPNASEVFLNLSNIQWHLGIAAFLVLISQNSKKIYWRVFDVFVLVATGLAGPLIILLLPIATILWFRYKQIWQKRNLILVSVLSVIQFLGIFLISHYKRVGGQPNADPLKFIEMIVGQIFSGVALGEKGVNLFYPYSILLIVIFIIMFVMISYAFKNGPTWLRLLYVYGVLVISSMLVSLRPTKGLDVWVGLTNPGGGQRYWYIPILIWITTLLWLLLNSKDRLLKYFSAVLLILLVFVAVPNDWKLHSYINYNFKSYSQKFESAKKGSTVSIPINPDWHMELNKK